MEEGKGIRIFLDTNVILSGLYSPLGPPGAILELFIRGELEVVISRQVLDETIRVVKEKLPGALPALREFLEHNPPEICPSAGPAETARWAKVLHPEDAAILAAAIPTKPGYFVTGDGHFLDNPALAREANLLIVSPAGLMDVLDR